MRTVLCMEHIFERQEYPWGCGFNKCELRCKVDLPSVSDHSRCDESPRRESTRNQSYPSKDTIAKIKNDSCYLIMTLLFNNHIEFRIRQCEPLLSPRCPSSPVAGEHTSTNIEVTTCADQCHLITMTAVAFTAKRAKATKKASNTTYDHDRHHSHDLSPPNSKAHYLPLLEPIIP